MGGVAVLAGATTSDAYSLNDSEFLRGGACFCSSGSLMSNRAELEHRVEELGELTNSQIMQ